MKMIDLSKIATGAVALGMFVVGSFAYGEELPALSKGMWEFTRTVQDPRNPAKPQRLTTQKCVSPTEDWKRRDELMTRMGCKFSPVKKDGNTYTFTVDCNLKSPSGTPVTSSTTTVITVQGSDAYTVKVEGVTNGAKTSESLTAKRTGDCSK